jgi:SAM-dependent methyltransferase
LPISQTEIHLGIHKLFSKRNSNPEKESLPCLLCGGLTTRIGRIIHASPTFVAGVPIHLPEVEFWMLQCVDCTFAFKSPQPPSELLTSCYEKASSLQWGENVDVFDRNYSLFSSLLSKHRVEGSLLDIGCFSGTLLSYLGASYSKFGVEPSRKAREIAMKRGIEILGPTIESTPQNSMMFDCVLSVDVLEHITEPGCHLERALGLVKPGGLLCLSTGNTDRYSWRLTGSRSWYAALPEHLCFYNPLALSRFFEKRDCKVVDVVHFRHSQSNVFSHTSQFMKNCIFRLAIEIEKRVPNPITGFTNSRGGPKWLSAKDHMIVCIRKPPANGSEN